MNVSENIVEVLLDHWDELPRLCGGKWPALYWRFIDLLGAFQEANDAGRAKLARRLKAVLDEEIPLFRFYTKPVTVRGFDHLAPRSDTRRGQGGGNEQETGKGVSLDARISKRLSPPMVVRHVDICAPPHLCVGRRAAITIGLNIHESLHGQASDDIRAHEGRRIEVIAVGEGVEVMTAPFHMRIEPDKDTPPAVVYVLGRKAGKGRLRVDFLDDREIVGHVSVALAIKSAEARGGTVAPAAPDIEVGGGPPSADLLIRVRATGKGYSVELHFDNPLGLATHGAVAFETAPRDYFEGLRTELESLLTRRPQGAPAGQGDAERLTRELDRLGNRLYDELWPENLKDTYRRALRSEKINTLLIDSDEPWAPWELLKPYDVTDLSSPVDDDFFCIRYRMTRWFTSSRGSRPVRRIGLEKLVAIIPDDASLPAAKNEAAFLDDLAKRCALPLFLPDRPDRYGVLELFESSRTPPVHAWHFATHGDYDFTAPGDAGVALQDNTLLRPKDIAGRVVTGIRAARPLIFFNACRVGQGGVGLTGLSGWAAAFIGNAAAGAFIGPLWAISDQAAFTFASAFYEMVFTKKETLAEAVHQARKITRNTHPGDPTWLAYSVYGHPNCSIRPWARASRRGDAASRTPDA